MLTSCSRLDDTNNTKEKQRETVSSSIQENYKDENFITEVSHFEGILYKSVGKYSGKVDKNLSQLSWENVKNKNSFIFIDKENAFVGSYVDDRLEYGKMLHCETTNTNGFINFKETAYIASEEFLKNKITANNQKSFDKIDSSEIPNAAKNVEYYQSKIFGISSKENKYRFYSFNDSNILIRENPSVNGKHYLMKYVK